MSVRQAAAAAGVQKIDRAVVLFSEVIELEPGAHRHRRASRRYHEETVRSQRVAATLVEVAATFDRGDYPAASQLVEAARSQDLNTPISMDGGGGLTSVWQRRLPRPDTIEHSSGIGGWKNTFARGDLRLRCASFMPC